MTGEAIRDRIDEEYKIMDKIVLDGMKANNLFILNPNVEAVWNRIFQIRTQCPHKYDSEGHCIYCDAQQPK